MVIVVRRGGIRKLRVKEEAANPVRDVRLEDERGRVVRTGGTGRGHEWSIESAWTGRTRSETQDGKEMMSSTWRFGSPEVDLGLDDRIERGGDLRRGLVDINLEDTWERAGNVPPRNF